MKVKKYPFLESRQVCLTYISYMYTWSSSVPTDKTRHARLFVNLPSTCSGRIMIIIMGRPLMESPRAPDSPIVDSLYALAAPSGG